MKSSSKSPLKDKPLRLPGQSLEEEHRRLIEEKLEQPLLAAAFLTALAMLEWFRYLRETPPLPMVYTLGAIFSVAFVMWRFFRLRGRLRALNQGMEGERAVGQFLEELRSYGYEVFHDLIGAGFNVDHVLIGPAGVFTIETKTWSKPAKGETRIKYDGDSLLLSGQPPTDAPLTQARAQAAWLRSVLSESTGKSFDVFPVVVFPGWFIEQSPGSLRKIWVLEPKALPSFLRNEPQRLEKTDVRLASYHLSRLIRAGERERSG